MNHAILLHLLSATTLTGAQASVVPDVSLGDAGRAAGAAVQAEQAAVNKPEIKTVVISDHAPPTPPQIIELRCPLDTGFKRVVDLSTGGEADWRVAGTSIGGFQKPRPITPDNLPKAWSVPFESAKWVNAYADHFAAQPDYPYRFTTIFRILKSPGEMRVMLKGSVLADERFTVELFEPEPETGPADHPSQFGVNADAPDPTQLTTHDVFDVDFLVGEAVYQGKHSGSKNPRAGNYRVVVTVENSLPHAEAVAMIAQLELTQTCLNWGKVVKSPKKRAKKKSRP